MKNIRRTKPLALIKNPMVQSGMLIFLILWLAFILNFTLADASADLFLYKLHIALMIDCSIALLASIVYMRDRGRTRLLSLGLRITLALLLVGLAAPFAFGGLEDLLRVNCGFAGGQISCIDAWQITLFPLLNPWTLWIVAVALPLVLLAGVWKSIRH